MSLRLSSEEQIALKDIAYKQGHGPSTFLRQIALSLINGKPALPLPRRKLHEEYAHALRQLLSELGKIGSNINQIAFHLNTAHEQDKSLAPRVEVLERIFQEIAQLRSELVDELRR